MKKNLALTSVLFGIAATAILFTGCSKPTERPSVIDSAIAANLMELKELGEITSAAKIVYSTTGEQNISQFAGSLKQVKIAGKVDALIKIIKTEATQKALAEHLKTGVIAIVVLDDQIKVLKVVNQTSNTLDTQVSSLTYMAKLKALSKASDAAAQQSIFGELEYLKYKSPAELNETFGLNEVASIKVVKHGNLDNLRNDYNEKKSILNVVDRPFDVSTHIVVGEEIGSEAEAAATKAAIEAKMSLKK